MSDFTEMQALLSEKADINARLRLIPYTGTPEIKTSGDKQYLYMRKRIGGRLTSTYVGEYSQELHTLLLSNAKTARELNRRLLQIEKELAALGYEAAELSERIYQNIEFARANMKASIYDQAVLEGVGTSFPQTEEIIDNGIVNGVRASDVQKILNLKHSWEFILDADVLQSPSDFYMMSHIAKLVNEGFYADGGRVRGVPVTIGGSSYVPPLPLEHTVKEAIADITTSKDAPIDIAVKLCLYCMKTQVFIDGNKRTAVIFANHYLTAHGQGLLVIPEAEVPQFKQLLVRYYEGEDEAVITEFLKTNCWKNF